MTASAPVADVLEPDQASLLGAMLQSFAKIQTSYGRFYFVLFLPSLPQKLHPNSYRIASHDSERPIARILFLRAAYKVAARREIRLIETGPDYRWDRALHIILILVLVLVLVLILILILILIFFFPPRTTRRARRRRHACTHWQITRPQEAVG